MKIFAETDRLLLREILPADEEGIFRLDADPEVHAYLGNQPIHTKAQAQETIAFIRAQYIYNGIGRWAVVEKETNQFIGWAGLKLIKEEVNGHQHFYDLGYRFIREYWGKGYATEAGRAALNYAFQELQLPVVYAIADLKNNGSCQVLSKLGFTCRQHFNYLGQPAGWFEITQLS